ncbi:uncharacterized protein F5Z01DRAFT_138710 [Emericellopsis atlantica]|uniref:Uncharacterized protein n=1 Tax=Emericellopsis atlantica TaxID=2614577 RepID=A0A9P7ZK53_9HYPO|nr:uncharacterized protein F5Z01DRAFT_138710 [Emericellopsis atlantica]KAG9253421.1 hypothetical protein F5Z01DRAFT_138710 [Emericellopsis atlantica]
MLVSGPVSCLFFTSRRFIMLSTWCLASGCGVRTSFLPFWLLGAMTNDLDNHNYNATTHGRSRLPVAVTISNGGRRRPRPGMRKLA